jgi:predicted heme/steroid binding protein
MLGSEAKSVDLTTLTGGGLTGAVEGSKLAGGSYEDKMNGAAPAAAAAAPAGGGGGGGAGISLDEVAKHNTKSDCWVAVNGQVLNVTSFLSAHPGGELAILTFAGKDATEEFNMIHPPDVVPKYAPDAIVGVVGTGGGGGQAEAVGGAPAAAAAPAKVARKDKGDVIANHQSWGHLDGASNWRIEGMDDNPGVFLVNVKAYMMASYCLLMSVLYEVGATIFTAQNIKISNDRLGLTRSAILLILFIVIHAVGNLHVFMGPNDFNGYGYFYVRLYWTGFGLPANIVEEYILLSALLHVFAGLKRTWDNKMNLPLSALIKPMNPFTNQLNLAISGLMLLTFMTIHLFQFRFGDTSQFGDFLIRPPPYLINFWGIFSLTLFWTDDKTVAPVGVRDIYKLEFQIFQNPLWCLFYILSVTVFVFHACMGWKKAVAAGVLGIPNGHKQRVNVIGYIIMFALGAIYISFPCYCIVNPEYMYA